MEQLPAHHFNKQTNKQRLPFSICGLCLPIRKTFVENYTISNQHYE